MYSPKTGVQYVVLPYESIDKGIIGANLMQIKTKTLRERCFLCKRSRPNEGAA